MNLAQKKMFNKSLTKILTANIQCAELLDYLVKEYKIDEKDLEQVENMKKHILNMNDLFCKLTK